MSGKSKKSKKKTSSNRHATQGMGNGPSMKDRNDINDFLNMMGGIPGMEEFDIDDEEDQDFNEQYFNSKTGSGKNKNNNEPNLYEILGVEKDASQEQIKKAFRVAAVKHHPDKGGDPEYFKNLSKAYDILSDAETRARYDRYGTTDESDAHAPAQRGPRIKPISATCTVPLSFAYNGGFREVEVDRRIVCKKCNGSGAKSSSASTECRQCKGNGVVMARSPFGIMQMECDVCDGTGTSISKKDRCMECMGEKIVEEHATLEVNIPRGVTDGTKLTLSGQGHSIPGTDAGDIVVLVKVTETNDIKRFGDNLLVEKEITLLEALTGFSFVFTHFDGRSITIHSSRGDVISPHDLKCVENEGMPLLKNSFLKGHLIFKFKIHFPKKLNEHDLAAVEKIFPHANDKTIGHYHSGHKVHEDDHLLSDFTGILETKTEHADHDKVHNHDHGDEDHYDDMGGGQPECRQM